MAKLMQNTVVRGPNGEPKPLEAGDDVPAWATDQVGEHLLDDSDAGPTPYREQKMADLKAEIARRNQGRSEADQINPEGRASIESYAEALEADDKAQAEADSGSGGGGSGSGS